jgi:ankyrin repeat protein
MKFLECIFRHSMSSTLDVNCEDNVQRTPLHYAAMCNRVGAAKELLHRGAVMDAVDYKDRSPLNYALKHGQDCEMVQILQNPSLVGCSPIKKEQKSSICTLL